MVSYENWGSGMRRKLTWLLATLAFVAVLIPAVSASAVVGYTISGTVVDAGGDPVSGAYVQLWDAADETQFGATVLSNASGAFTLGPVANGDYIIELTDEIESDYWSYTDVTVSGANLTGVEVLDTGGSGPGPDPSVISTVTVVDDGTGLPIADAELTDNIDFWDMTNEFGQAFLYDVWDELQVSANGYTTKDVAGGIPEGSDFTVRLALDPEFGRLEGVAKDASTNTTITRDPDTQNPIEATVYQYDAGMEEYYDTAYAMVQADGRFSTIVPVGESFVEFIDSEGQYAYEFYDGAMFLSDADAVTVPSGAKATITVTLEQGASIDGAVLATGGWTALDEPDNQYVEAWAYSATDEAWLPVLYWGQYGSTYSALGLPAGTYKLAMHTVLADPSGNPWFANGSYVYSNGWYKPGAVVPYSESNQSANIASATPVVVAKGAKINDIDFTFAPLTSKVTRIPGADRYAVAVGLAKQGWDPNGDGSWEDVNDIIIANGENGKEADPLAAAGLASVWGAPVLLTKASGLPAVTKAAITQIAEANPDVCVHIIGGIGSVPDARWNDIRKIPGVSQDKDRIEGADRYAVTANIALRMLDYYDPAEMPGVLIVAGDNAAAFYDALAASPIAYNNSMPMLSVRKGSVPPAVADVLANDLDGVTRYVVSSSAYISDSTKVKVGATRRLASTSDRYLAATQIANVALTEGWLDANNTAVAAKLPDALTGGVFAGRNQGVMLFTDSTKTMKTASSGFITTHKAEIGNGWIFGGTGSVTSQVETQYRNLLK